jgi:hypothetical protein
MSTAGKRRGQAGPFGLANAAAGQDDPHPGFAALEVGEHGPGGR